MTARHVYLNHSLRGPLPTRTAARLEELVADLRDDGAAALARWRPEAERARENVARLLGTSVDSVAFLRNASEAISAVANGIAWAPGDRVIVSDLEYPANVYPWMNLAGAGVEVVVVPSRDGRVELDDLDVELRRGARVLATSAVTFTTGFRIDLDTLGARCADTGTVLVVDAVQALGSVAMDVTRSRVPVVVGDGRKWLLGTDGVGILAIDPATAGELRVPTVGALSVQNASDYLDYDLTLRSDARRYESGALNTPGTVALAESTALLLEAGADRIEARILELTDHLVGRLQEAGATLRSPRERPGERSGIVACAIAPEDVPALRHRLAADRIQCRLDDTGLLCASPHFYNVEAELDRLVAAIGAASCPPES